MSGRDSGEGGLDARQGLPLRAVKPISRSQWNGGYGADSGPSRGDPCRRAFRPIEASTDAISNGSYTSTPAVRCAQSPMACDRVSTDPRMEIVRQERPSAKRVANASVRQFDPKRNFEK